MQFRNVANLVAVAVVATGLCTPANAGPEDDTLRIAMAEEILNLDYNYTTKREYIILAQLTDAKLFEFDPETQDIKPSVASEFEWVDETTLDVILRDDVKFHDGSRLKAEDVAYTYNWLRSPESEANATGVVERWLEKAEVVAPNRVRFHMTAVYPLVLRDMASRVMLRKAGTYGEDGQIDRDAMSSALVATGPYRVVSFEPGTELVLERFEDYFGEKPAIENVTVRNIPDIGTQQAELMSGGIDWMFKVPEDVATAADAIPSIDFLSGADLRIGFLVLDAGGWSDAEGPMTKVQVRQAVNHALNTEEIAKFLMGESSQAIHTACHPAQFGCDQSVTKYDYDPQRAKELLAEAGYPEGFPLDLWAYRDKAVAEAVASDLTAVGIDVNLRYVKLESLNQARAAREIPAYFGTWGSGGTADTAAIAQIHFGDSDRNLSGDDQLSELVLAAEQTADPDERKAFYSQALGVIADEAYWAPLVTYTANYLVAADLEFPLSPDGLPRLQNARWK
ncbi:ABC transporter substrate-binding protein [Algicella marina]|uniref:ABC transporter substrate-binding protein n=1 Tax=Algicella marina TaxID=2683284 RepID=A0A6P1T0E0_9RHOB|nr:ABC transporter substrate-binding protein [Algicella marina]QHQ36198.1 ABC transporter substrate-binding protein [Algicella marina]